MTFAAAAAVAIFIAVVAFRLNKGKRTMNKDGKPIQNGIFTCSYLMDALNIYVKYLKELFNRVNLTNYLFLFIRVLDIQGCTGIPAGEGFKKSI